MVKLVQEYFTESAERARIENPKRRAVYIGDDLSEGEKEEQRKKKILNESFIELEHFSNQLARHLIKDLKIQRGDRVAFMFKKLNFTDSIASILAILKCGAIYVPIHYTLPPERVAKILNDSAAKFLICPSTFRKEFEKHIDARRFLFLDRERYKILRKSGGPLDYKSEFKENKGESSDVVYIMYTSGSTGMPKGVQITHTNIINATEWAVEELDITSRDRMSQHPPLSFDLSTFDLYCAFKAGATLYPLDEIDSFFPGELMRLIERHDLTIWNSVPSVMVSMAVAGLVKSGRLPKLEKVFFNGEGFPAKYLDEWKRAFPDKEFINMYGPTETTVQCTFYRIPKGPLEDLTKLVPIGKACRDVEVFDVDGELYVAGKGVGPGYWNDSEKTEKSFIHDPRPGKTGRVYKTGDLVKLREDGNYEFIGRKDNQVKIHGYRIELGDIDSALYSLSYVNEAATIAVQEHETGGSFLVAFIDLKLPKTETDIKTDLGEILPSYMIPKRIIERKLTKTGTGKIDRQKLKHEYEQRG